MSPDGPIEAGGRFGDLEIESEIGSGGFGVVFRAKDALVGRTVALKVLRPAATDASSDEFRRNFLNEVHALGSLVHPNVATLYHVHALEGGGWMLELEFVDGTSFENLLANGRRLPIAEAVDLARGMGAGLRAAHAAGVVHGDVKPANVLRANGGAIKLVDFGLARLLTTKSARSSTEGLAGTPHYVAPEIVEGARHAPASDVWGLGATLYRALSGRLPFDAESVAALFFRVLNVDPLPLPEDVPAPLRALVLACLAKRPEARPALDDAFFAALDRRRSPRGDRSPAATSTATAAGEIVGREDELARLRDALGRAAKGATALAAVTGPAGIGKTRLLAALEHEARARGFHALHAVVTPHEGLLRPLHRALLGANAAPDARGPGDAKAGSSRAGRPAVAHLADVERRMTALAADRAVLLVVEDFHRASNEDVRMLGRLATRLEGARVAIVVSERVPDLDATEGVAPRFEALLGDRGERIDLGALPRDALHRLLEETTGGGAPADLLERAVVRSGGNPLFAIHMLSHAVESRAARRGGVDSRSGSVTAEPPPILRDLMVRRLRIVPEELREVLDAAAVEGATFDADAISGALGLPPIDVLRRLQRLARTPGLVVPLEHGYRFTHPLLHETVYAEVAPDLRRTLHRAYATALETAAADVDPERLGSHWERADDLKRAAPHLLKASVRSGERLEYYRCVDLATRAGIVPGTMGTEFVRENATALLELASVMSEIGRPAERDAVFSDVANAAATLSDPVLALRVSARRGLARFLGSGLLEGDEERLVEAATALPDCIDRGIAWYTLGMIEKSRGRFAEAEASLRKADAQYVALGATGRHGSALDQLASVAGLVGDMRRAERLFRDAAQVCRDAGRLANAEISEINAILTQVELGSIDDVADRLARSARLLDADGGPVPAARMRVKLAEIRYALGDLVAARTLADRASVALGGIGMRAGVVDARWASAEFAIAAGDGAAAEEHIRAGRAAARALESPSKMLRFDGLDVLWALAFGTPADAADLARRAVAQSAAGAPTSSGVGALPPLLEAIVLGLPPSIVEPLATAYLAASSDDEAAHRVTRAVLEGSTALLSNDAGGLDRAAAALLRPDVGLRRALWHTAGTGWRAFAAALRRDTSDADRLAHEALLAARRLGHRPLEQWALRVSTRLTPSP